MYADFGMHTSARTLLRSLTRTARVADQAGLAAGGILTVLAAGLPTLILLASLVGCGSPGSPQPPSLKLPVPPADLTAIRSGGAVMLQWTMPRRATDRVPLAGDQRAVICRSLDPAKPCVPVGEVLLPPGLPASYTDPLPAELLTGPAQLLTYTILLENHKQRAAGPSNAAYTAEGAAPPAITGLRAEVGPAGIVLHWQAAPAAAGSAVGSAGSAAQYAVRLRRTRVAVSGENLTPLARENRAGVPQPADQVLEVRVRSGRAGTLADGWVLDQTVDENAALNHTYSYTAERVARVLLGGHAIEVSGSSGGPVTLIARDLFPPGVPQGLEAVADEAGRSIDLSWNPDSDLDLSGYAVYRRVAKGSALAVRVSGAVPLVNPAWRDQSVQPRVRYAYSVSALDESGNESARSPEVEETLEPVE